DEILIGQAGELRGTPLQRQQPFGDSIGRAKGTVVEIIAPAEGGGEPLADPSLELKRRKRLLVDLRDQRSLLLRADDRVSIAQPWKDRCVEEIHEQGCHGLGIWPRA